VGTLFPVNVLCAFKLHESVVAVGPGGSMTGSAAGCLQLAKKQRRIHLRVLIANFTMVTDSWVNDLLGQGVKDQKQDDNNNSAGHLSFAVYTKKGKLLPLRQQRWLPPIRSNAKPQNLLVEGIA
jgi:hypothetical protein